MLNLCRAFFWEGEIQGTEISKLDVKELICDRAIAYNIIDSYAQLLTDDLPQEDSQQLGRSAFFSSESWVSSNSNTLFFCFVLFCFNHNSFKHKMSYIPVSLAA